MLKDRYGLDLSTASVDARDAYVEAADLALTFYPGAAEAYDRAIAADPNFALAYAAKAQMLARQSDVAGAREALAAAKDRAPGVSEREASHIAFFDLAFAGRTDDAIAALYPHLKAWPCDALVVSTAANPNGLLGGSGRIGQKHRIAELMDSLAPHYGDDFWFLSYHAMAMSEDGRLGPARATIERSVAANPKNAHAAHGFAHVCYESGALDDARRFLSSWLPAYPRDGFFHGHLSWHFSLCEIQAGDWDSASHLYREGIALDRHSGGPQNKISDVAAFLWRSELAGYPRDADAWRGLYDYANSALPRPGSGLADLHVILALAVMRDDAGLEARRRQMEAMAREGRYPSTSYLPSLAPGFVAFERGDFAGAIGALAPLVEQNERIGGSRAQHDLIEFTLLKAYLDADRPEEARRLLSGRRPGASGVPVAGSQRCSDRGTKFQCWQGGKKMSSIEVAPLTLHIGAEIRGVDLKKPLPQEQLREVRAAFLKWKVVFFRDQHLDHAQHVALARQFGEPTIGHAVFGYVEGHPEIYSVAKNRTANENREAMAVTPWSGWHADITAAVNPPCASILRGVTIPPYGGDTFWTNLAAAYDGLSPTMQGFADTLRGIHAFVPRETAGAPSEYNERVRRRALRSEHPLVTVHAETGERVLYVSPSFLKSIVGLSPRESQKILEILWEHVTRPEYTVRFKWNAGDIAFWDNRSTAHLAPRDIFQSDLDRQLYRVTLVGEPLVGVDGEPSRSIEGQPIRSAADELQMMAAE